MHWALQLPVTETCCLTAALSQPWMLVVFVRVAAVTCRERSDLLLVTSLLLPFQKVW